ncbi:serine/threonine-protein kinase [Rathayibacter sp. YIM 133350]|uniref:serine/threonine-protein kinase n=1 Tax=Rathayibacter sp. YIM 133350 TaxID=3131992 RepID=UPI00307D1044
MCESGGDDSEVTMLAGRYTPGSVIARGGMGTVVTAWDTVLRRTVAVKIMNADSSAEASARAEREIDIASHAHHPGFVEVIDVGTVALQGSDRRYIVMEYVKGSSLQQILDERRPEPRAIAEIAAQVADALGYLHLRGILHLDVKPANILVEPSPTLGFGRRARLIDFGIAQAMDGHGRAEGAPIVASAAYMSPEHVQGRPLTGASDVYSLGLVLLRCLTGHEEFAGDRAESAMARLRRDPIIPENLLSGWDDLLRAMTRREPGQRPLAHDVAAEFSDLARSLRHPAPSASTASPLIPDTIADLETADASPAPLDSALTAQLALR